MSVAAKRTAKIQIETDASKMDRGLADARRKMRALERDNAREQRKREKDTARAKKKEEKDAISRQRRVNAGVKGVAGGIKDGILTGLGMSAAGGLQSMVGDVLDYERSLTRLQITAKQSPSTMRMFSDGVMRASNETGIARTQILGAASAYVALTGDMNTAIESTSTWAKIAQATNTPMEDIASTAAALSQQMGITSGSMEAVFSGLAAQGKAGAIELKDLAGLMAQIAPQWAMFKDGKGAKGVAQLGAALQVVKRGFGGDASETVTGLQSLLIAVTKNAGRFEDEGIKIFDVKNGKKTMKDVFSIVDSISKSKLVNDPEAMEKAFGRVEAYRAYLQLSQNKDMLTQLTAEAADGTVIQKDFATYAQSASGKMEMAWNRIKNAIAAALTPERIDGFANALLKAAGMFEKLIGLISKVGDLLETVGESVQSTGVKYVIRQASGKSAKEKMEMASRYAGMSEGELMAAGGFSSDDRDQVVRSLMKQAVMPSASTMVALGGANIARAATQENEFDKSLRPAMFNPAAVKSALDENKLANAIAEALAKAGIGKVQVGNETVHKAGANAVSHRRGEH